YQEILTDPSYRQQIVTLTYPHIGNVGVNEQDAESDRVQLAGLVVREIPRRPSNFRASGAFTDYLKANGLVAVAGLDTRRLTRLLRDKGAQAGCLMAGEVDAERALAQARGFAGLDGADLASEVSVAQPYSWTRRSWQLDGNAEPENEEARFHVVVYDYGVKRNILRMLSDRGCR